MRRVLQMRELSAIGLLLSIALIVLCGIRIIAKQTEPEGGETPNRFPISVLRLAGAFQASFVLQHSETLPLGFTMADFTGDTHPDLATVELDRLDSTKAYYWIEIRLTEGGRQTLGITGPFGGLEVTPKDVTGDGNLDLVVRAARSSALVGVFLNDGNGHFQRADASGFAGALGDESSHLIPMTERLYPTAALGFPEFHVAGCPLRPLWQSGAPQHTFVPASESVYSHRFLAIHSDRAPPAFS